MWARSALALAMAASLVALLGTPSTVWAEGQGIDPAHQGAEGPTRPNIVVVMTDDQTYESAATMPNVRRLAADGTTFTNYHANFPLCCPSRATLLTGQYVHRHGVWQNQGEHGGYPALLPRVRNTLPVWLRRAGYKTILVGKFLNGYQAGRHGVPPGWDRWRVSTSGRNAYRYFTTELLHEDGSVREHSGYKTDILGRIAVNQIRSTATRQPFFLWLSFNAPHVGAPRDAEDSPRLKSASPAPRHTDLFEGARAPARSTRRYNERDVSDKPRHIRRLPRLGPGLSSAVDEAYSQQLEALASVDDALGALRDELESSGRAENTVVVFTSDNGYFYGEHRIPAGKQLPYPAASRLPLVVAGPGFAAGRGRAEPRSNVDLAATIVTLANAEARRRLDGRPLTQRVGSGRSLLLEGRIPGGSAGVTYQIRQYAALLTPRWLYVRYRYTDGAREVELYDLGRDPRMLRSLPGRAQLKAELRQKLERLAGYRV